MTTKQLWDIAAGQLGLVTRTQSSAVGVGKNARWHLVEAGRLAVVHEGVYRSTSAPTSGRQRVLAAVLAAGEGAVASHRTAAGLWGAPVGMENPIDVIVPNRGRSPVLAGVMVHRPTDVRDLRPVVQDGIPCSNPLRTLVDLGAVAPWAVRPALETFVTAGLVSIPAVRAARERHGGKGRRGVGVLGAVIENRALGDRPADSVVEARFADLLAEQQLPLPTHHHVVRAGGRVFELDYAYVDFKIAIEIDGFEFHADRVRFNGDRERDALLSGLGWIVLRFTWLQIVRRPWWVAGRVSDLLRLRAA